MQEKTLRKRSAYVLEIMVYKKQKNTQSYEENIKEKHEQKIVINDVDDQSSDTPIDIEVNGLSGKKKTRNISRQTVSSGSSPHTYDNTLTQHKSTDTSIEQKVIAKVDSSIRTLRDEMSKRENEMQQMFKSFRESIKKEYTPKVVTEYRYLRPRKEKGKNMK